MFRSLTTAVFACAWALLSPATALADDSPGLEALDRFREGKSSPRAVENRFFLKQQRFELAPMFGYVPNNPFARRFSGAIGLGYHFNETVAANVYVSYSPDAGENDLKGLVTVLLDRAHSADSTTAANFQQPLDKVSLAFTGSVSWHPIYGKINLVGETVLNFDLYGQIGAGMVSKTNWVAKYDEGADTEDPNADIVALTEAGNEVKVSPMVGVGTNYFINQLMAVKIDARTMFYIDQKPTYNPDEPETDQQLYNNFTASIGIALFLPRMKPRLYDF
jgi:outer membrane beta-barrel protein